MSHICCVLEHPLDNWICYVLPTAYIAHGIWRGLRFLLILIKANRYGVEVCSDNAVSFYVPMSTIVSVFRLTIE